MQSTEASYFVQHVIVVGWAGEGGRERAANPVPLWSQINGLTVISGGMSRSFLYSCRVATPQSPSALRAPSPAPVPLGPHLSL